MITFRELALLVTALAAGTILVQSAVRAENPGCTNNTCKDINIYRNCGNNGDFVRKYITCLVCKNSGRCDTGNTNTRSCNQMTQLQKFKSITANEVCSCTNAPAGGWAERSGTYTDDNWTDSAVEQFLCAGS